MAQYLPAVEYSPRSEYKIVVPVSASKRLLASLKGGADTHAVSRAVGSVQPINHFSMSLRTFFNSETDEGLCSILG